MTEANISLTEIESIVSKYLNRLNKDTEQVDEEKIKYAEERILLCADQLAKSQKISDLLKLLIITRPFFSVLGKAKASKLVRAVVEYCLKVEQSQAEKIKLCTDCIDWAKQNKRVFLRRTLEARLVRLYNDMGRHTEALKLAIELAKDLRKLDDRELLIEVTLEESKAAFALNNLSKAKTSLVLARTSANGCYVTTGVQAAIDLQSGILYAADEKDFKTAYSYFFEAFERFVEVGDKHNATKSLKYMCLCKIMLNESEQIRGLLDTKTCLAYTPSRDIQGIKEMSDAFKERSLARFQKCLEKYPKELMQDTVVKSHSNTLTERMLEKEISRVIEPYSMVDIQYVSTRIGIPNEKIEKKLATMLLDQKFKGVIDQKAGSLTLYPKEFKDESYEKAVNLVKELSQAVDACYQKSIKVYK